VFRTDSWSMSGVREKTQINVESKHMTVLVQVDVWFRFRDGLLKLML